MHPGHLFWSTFSSAMSKMTHSDWMYLPANLISAYVQLRTCIATAYAVWTLISPNGARYLFKCHTMSPACPSFPQSPIPPVVRKPVINQLSSICRHYLGVHAWGSYFVLIPADLLFVQHQAPTSDCNRRMYSLYTSLNMFHVDFLRNIYIYMRAKREQCPSLRIDISPKSLRSDSNSISFAPRA